MNPATKYYGLTNAEFLRVADPLLDRTDPLIQELVTRLERADPNQQAPHFYKNPDAVYSLRANK